MTAIKSRSKPAAFASAICERILLRRPAGIDCVGLVRGFAVDTGGGRRDECWMPIASTLGTILSGFLRCCNSRRPLRYKVAASNGFQCLASQNMQGLMKVAIEIVLYYDLKSETVVMDFEYHFDRSEVAERAIKRLTVKGPA